MTGLEYLLLFAVGCVAVLAVVVVLELLTEPPAPVERFVPLSELYRPRPRHAAPENPFEAWRQK